MRRRRAPRLLGIALAAMACLGALTGPAAAWSPPRPGTAPLSAATAGHWSRGPARTVGEVRYVVGVVVPVRRSASATAAKVGYTGLPAQVHVVPGPAGWWRVTSGAPAGYIPVGATSTQRAPASAYPGTNGRLDPTTLCAIPRQPAVLLRCDAERAYVAMDAAYAASHQGSHLAVDEGYRPYFLQQWYFERWGYPRAAYPGHSNHGVGIAIDFPEQLPYSYHHAVYLWLTAHASRFGWHQPTAMLEGGTNPEYWHWEYHP